jgi:nitrate/TMAO reductase-like tetraheme cytochrome c subunit
MTDRPGFIRRLWRWFFGPTARYGWGTILIAGGFCGILFWGGLHWAVEVTNKPEFCMSCHEMADNVGQEWMQSTHYRYNSGVRATCADCHVPRAWLPKMLRKVAATVELYGHFTGVIDTRAKFLAHRSEMAERVWADMRANDSRGCRNCHSEHAMNFETQSRRAQEKMVPGIEEGKTCIECHQGIAHRLPPRDD